MKPNRLHKLISVVLSASMMLAGLTVAPRIALAVPVDGGTVTSDLRCVTFVSSTTGFAAGAAGVILKTTNAGASWRTVRSGDTYDFRGISFADANNGWAITLYGEVVRTTNAGESWSLVTSDAGGASYAVERFYDIDFWNSTSGFAVGGAQGTPPLVAQTTNAGSFWSVSLDSLLGSYAPPETQPPFPRDGLGYAYGMDVRSSAKAWVAGQDVFKTPTLSVIWVWNGTSWTQQSVAGTGRLLDIAFGSDTSGIAVGDTGVARYTLNGGTSWIAATTGVTTELSGVGMTSTGSGWAVGQSGRILRTTNYGATWASQTSGTGSYLEDIAVLDSTTAVAVGRGGTILRTVDGSTWKAPISFPVVSWVESPSHPVGEWNSSTSANILWSATGDIDGYGFEFDQSPTTTPTVLNTTATSRIGTATASGAWYAHVAAHDTLGRWSAPKHRQVLVDIDKPVATDDVNPAGYSSAATVTISATDAHSGVASIAYSVNGVAQAPVAASVASVPFPSVGEYTLTYTATDNAGNVSLYGSATVYVRPPAVPVMTGLSSASHPLGQWGSSSTVSLAWNATGTGVSGYGFVFDQAPTTAVSTQTTTATSGVGTATGSGTWYAHVAAWDSYGQLSATRHLQVLVDMARPLVTDDVDPAGYEGSATINLNATDVHSGVASISYSVSGGATTTVAGASASITRSTPGTYTVSYIASDTAGNASVLASAIVYVRALPPAAPVVTALSSATHPVGTWVSALGVTLAWSATGTGISGYGLAFDQSAPTSVLVQTTTATSGTGTATGSGAWYAHVAAVDSFAQWSATRHLQVLVDTTRPLVTDDVDPAGYVSSALVTLSATDAHSGVAR
ncbi:MAG: YCF48-related protein, partial [Coriobacteriia bacterium]|nr:YCF48-related protein [Coriobacteriia bacterium]